MFLRAVIIIVVVIITLVIIGLTEHSSFGCVFLPPTRDYFMAACDHTSGRIKLDFALDDKIQDTGVIFASSYIYIFLKKEHYVLIF